MSCAFALYWLITHDSLTSSPFDAAGSSPVTGSLTVPSRILEYSTAYVGQFGWLEVSPSLSAVYPLASTRALLAANGGGFEGNSRAGRIIHFWTFAQARHR